MQLYTFFNSSAAYRVRIALALKGLAAQHIAVNLRSGAQRSADFLALSPAGLVPTLVDGDVRLTESLAIIDYLDCQHPTPLLVPSDGPARGQVLEIAQLIACDIHPLNNLRVLKYLKTDMGLSEAQKNTWYAHWVAEGFHALEALLPAQGDWCVGNAPTLADCCLIPQVANAERVQMDVSAWPRIARIAHSARQHPAFVQAAPKNQADYVG